MFALHPGTAGAALSALPARFPKPQAIIVVSPHWETDIPAVGCTDALETMYDFGNFDPRLFEIVYPAHGSSVLANRVANALKNAGLPVSTDSQRGLDHGAWVPLRYLYPAADVPVIPLSLQHAGGPQDAYRVGQALSPLRQEGFLIVGSGNITHNLREWQMLIRTGAQTPPHVSGFSDWVFEQLTAGQTDTLLNYRSVNEDAIKVHPRDEHFLPLFTALGAAGSHASVEAFHRGISDIVLAMDGYLFSDA